MPVDAALGDAALRALSRDKALGLLRETMARNATLHRQLSEAERRLDASLARERDLLEVLARWQEREMR